MLILSLLMVGEDTPRSQTIQMPSIEECIATSAKMLMSAEKELPMDKISGYSAQCVVLVKPGVKA